MNELLVVGVLVGTLFVLAIVCWMTLEMLDD